MVFVDSIIIAFTFHEINKFVKPGIKPGWIQREALRGLGGGGGGGGGLVTYLGSR